jgi:hypothetical protein
MAGWFERLMGRGEMSAPPTKRAGVFHSVSHPDEAWSDAPGRLGALDGVLALPNGTPFYMLEVYRYLRDAIPDISDAVWTWKRLCQTGYDVEIQQASSSIAEGRAREAIDGLNRRVNSGDRGMDGLLDVFYTSLFTFGAAALEIVPTPSSESIQDIVPIDVWTLRFRREQGKLQAYQVHDGELIKLPMQRFIYVGMDKDGTNPYGRSMLRSIPFLVKIQQRLIEDMAKATHNAGWPKLHVRYTPDDRARGESSDGYATRLESTFSQLKETLEGIDADQNLVTYDNVAVDLVQGNQNSQIFYENHKAIEEQVITGTHLMPILLGRNYGTTETYGTAQFEIINRQVEGINRSVKRILERVYGMELAMLWGSARAKVTMRGNRTVDVLREAQARGREIENSVKLRDEGYLDHKASAALLGID